MSSVSALSNGLSGMNGLGLRRTTFVCLTHSLVLHAHSLMPAMSKPEAKIEDYLVAGTLARGGWPAKMIDAGRKGAPDRTLRFPRRLLTTYALTIYVETKAKNGILKAWQKEYHKDLRALGHVVLVLWTIPQVEDFFVLYDSGHYG
jgi:hypothetical protein